MTDEELSKKKLLLLFFVSINCLASSTDIVNQAMNETIKPFVEMMPKSEWIENTIEADLQGAPYATIRLTTESYDKSENDQLFKNIYEINKAINSKYSFDEVYTIYHYVKDIYGTKVNGLLFKTTLNKKVLKDIDWSNKDKSLDMLRENTRYFDYEE